MVLCLKAWESRSLPGLPGARFETKKSKEPSITMTASAVTYPAALNTRPFAHQGNKVCRGMEQPGSSSGS